MIPARTATAAKVIRTVVTTALAILVIVVLWEGYKWTGQQTGGNWPGTGIELPVSTDDVIMPHASDIAAELVSDIRDGRSTLPLSVYLLKKAWFTLQEAAIGFFLGLGNRDRACRADVAVACGRAWPPTVDQRVPDSSTDSARSYHRHVGSQPGTARHSEHLAHLDLPDLLPIDTLFGFKTMYNCKDALILEFTSSLEIGRASCRERV